MTSKDVQGQLERALADTRQLKVVGADGQEPEAVFPMVVAVAGVKAVVLAADDYRRLVSMPRPVLPPRPRRPRELPSTVERDPEVSTFLRDQFCRAVTIDTAHSACLERFGAERTPSKSRIARFREKVRRESMAVPSTAPEWPIAATIAGVQVVTIPLSDYAELLDCRRRLAALNISREHLVADPRSRIDRDPEVAAFLADCLGRMLLKDAYAACRARFGAERTPGRSTIDRFWRRLRKV